MGYILSCDNQIWRAGRIFPATNLHGYGFPPQSNSLMTLEATNIPLLLLVGGLEHVYFSMYWE